MKRPCPATEATIRRHIRAAERAGLRVTRICADGSVMVAKEGEESSLDIPQQETSEWEGVGQQ
jgi:hypothetical protein